jgi:putative peptidoglycan lipid II flippase
MTDRTPEPVDEPVELSWPDHRSTDLADVAAAARAAAARARAEARLSAPIPGLPDPALAQPDPDITGPFDPAFADSSPLPGGVPSIGVGRDPGSTPDPESAVGTNPANPTDEVAPSGTRRMVSAAVVMMSGTIMSRVLGLVRVVLAAYLLGNNSRQAEMLALATTVPNSLYLLFAGGALNTVLVPQIVRAVKNDPDGGEAYTNRIMTAFLVLVAALAVVMTVASPAITWLYTDDAWHQPALAPQFSSMVLLTALCMPQVFFYGMFFLLAQVLNAREKFGPMMWAPIANNVVAVVMLALYAAIWGFHSDTSQPFSAGQLALLGIGSVVGIAIQTAVLVPFLRATGFHYKPRFDFRHTGLGHTFHIAKWTLGLVAVNQITQLIVTRFLTSATAGGTGAGMAAFFNANLLWILPHSLITVSLATAILPSMSRMAAAHQPNAVSRELERAIRLTTTALVPVSLLYLTIGVPIAMLAFRGATKGGDLVGWTLVGFALGLIPYSVQYLMLRGFYAFEDTRSTFYLQVVIGVANALLAFLFIGFVQPGPAWVAPALALANTLAYGIGLVASGWWLRRHIPTFDLAGIGRHTAVVAGAALPAALAAYGVVTLQKGWSTSLLADLAGITGAGLAAGLVYLMLTRLMGVSEINQVISLVRRRGGKEEGTMTEADDPRGTARPDAPADPAAGPLSAPTTVLPAVIPPPAPTTGESRTDAQESPEPRPAAVTDIVGEPEEPDLDRAPRLPVGHVLGGRFRLEDELAIRGATATWRATDQRLSRSVLVHLLSADDPATPAIVAAAKRAAQTTDARFLRVLDAVDEPISVDAEIETDATQTPYVVCEWAEGLNLRHLLQSAPLTALEAAWLVHQLADSLAGTHAHRMYHQRLNLDTVVVTTTGNVKTVGFMIEAALHDRALRERGEAPLRAERQESEDVLALGRILYAALVSRWPGSVPSGLPEAPITATGAWQSPAQVRAGVSPALDRIADRILNPEPRSGEPLRSVSRIALELAAVLGTADASHDLERRVRHLLANPAAVWHQETPGDHDEPVVEKSEPIDSQPIDLQPIAAPVLQTPVPPPPVPHEAAATRRPPWVFVLAGIVVLGLIGAAIAAGMARTTPGAEGTARPTSSSAADTTSAGPYPISSVVGFDPEADKGNGEENPKLVPLAVDGNPATAWTTETYRGNAKMGGLKPGVGLVVDLGKPVAVSAVQVQLTGSGTSLELRIPAKDAATVSAPPMGTVKEWTVVATAVGAGDAVQLTPQQRVTTRYVLVYLTQLPSIGNGRFQGGISEITARP